jgi:hypothetical protein
MIPDREGSQMELRLNSQVRRSACISILQSRRSWNRLEVDSVSRQSPAFAFNKNDKASRLIRMALRCFLLHRLVNEALPELAVFLLVKCKHARSALGLPQLQLHAEHENIFPPFASRPLSSQPHNQEFDQSSGDRGGQCLGGLSLFMGLHKLGNGTSN